MHQGDKCASYILEKLGASNHIQEWGAMLSDRFLSYWLPNVYYWLLM